MRRKAEVISQHTFEGQLIPIKIRIYDDDGELQAYAIRAYKNLNAAGSYIMPNEVAVTGHIRYFQCKIAVFGEEKIVNLSYHFDQQVWFVNF